MSKKSREEYAKRVAQGGPITSPPAGEPDSVETVSPLNPDGATVNKDPPEAPPAPDKDGIARGQIYDGVVVPNRPINRLGLRAGSVLPAIRTEAPYGDGRWMCSFVGEHMTKIDTDAEMLKTGKLRAGQ